eukprot:403335899
MLASQQNFAAINSEINQIEHELHQKRLNEIRPIMKIERPLSPTCLKNKQKQRFINAEKDYDIQRKNTIFINKAFKIVNNQNVVKKKPPTVGTLNTKVRLDNLKMIWQENNRFLNKLQTIKTSYPVEKLTKEFRHVEKVKTNIQYNSNRFERNNFFLKLDKKGSVLGQSNQRVFQIKSPFSDQSRPQSAASSGQKNRLRKEMKRAASLNYQHFEALNQMTSPQLMSEIYQSNSNLKNQQSNSLMQKYDPFSTQQETNQIDGTMSNQFNTQVHQQQNNFDQNNFQNQEVYNTVSHNKIRELIDQEKKKMRKESKIKSKKTRPQSAMPFKNQGKKIYETIN